MTIKYCLYRRYSFHNGIACEQSYDNLKTQIKNTLHLKGYGNIYSFCLSVRTSSRNGDLYLNFLGTCFVSQKLIDKLYLLSAILFCNYIDHKHHKQPG